jgi:hypothetical protein
MPRQKLARKPPSRRGTQGQLQTRGPHDPEHQEGRKVKNTTRSAKSQSGDREPALAPKRSPL